MQSARRYVMTIAGFDPSAGAGLLADVKTFEQHRVYGLSVSTASTLQTEEKFHTVRWSPLQEVLGDIEIMMDTYPIQLFKTGIVPSFQYLLEVIRLIIHKNPAAKIIVDPVLKSTSGFNFIAEPDRSRFQEFLKLIFLITPNASEAIQLTGIDNVMVASKELSEHCHVLLKGGHLDGALRGVDHLMKKKGATLPIIGDSKETHEKHGSGCVLSSAIAANLANGLTLEQSCRHGKAYTEKFLRSNNSRLGYHYV